MDCCGLSSTGLQNIDANELTSDNVTIYSSLNVSGNSFLNNVLVNNNSTLLSSLNVSGNSIFNNMLVNNNSTLLSSLNVSGYTTMNNTTNINVLLYVSGTNILQTVNNSTMNLTDINNLFIIMYQI